MALSNISLLALNDDCLDNIFQYFTLDELMLISGQVDVIIDAAIERQLHRFRHFEFSMRYPPKYSNEQLEALGRHLFSLSIYVGYSIPEKEVLNLLQPLCVGAKAGGRLRNLKIWHAYLTGDYVNVILPLATLLHELDLSRCDVENFSQFLLLLNAATNLKTLALLNKDANNLDQAILSRLTCLKINWLMGTTLLNVDELTRLYPNLDVRICPADSTRSYGVRDKLRTLFTNE